MGFGHQLRKIPDSGGDSTLENKKVTIISPRLITRNEAYRLFLTALESQGFTLEPVGDGFLKIVLTNLAKYQDIPIYGYGQEKKLPRDKSFATLLVRLKHVDPQSIATRILNRLKGQQGDIIAHGDTLGITDSAMAIRKILKVIKQLDVPSGLTKRSGCCG